VVIVLGHDLREDVEVAGAHHEVVHLGHGFQCVRYRLRIAFHSDPDHRRAGEPHLERIGHGDDLHDSAVLEPLHPLPNRRLGQAHGLADGGVRATPVLLQLLDDRLGNIVKGGGGHPIARRHDRHDGSLGVAMASDSAVF